MPLLLLASPPTASLKQISKKIFLYLLVHQNYHTEFLTGTTYNWQHLLKGDEYKQIVIDSFNWLVKNKNVPRKDVEGALFSFTAHEFKRYLKKSDLFLLEKHFVNKSDRSFQFWEREPMVKNVGRRNFFGKN